MFAKSLLSLVAALGLARAHTIITYPGWRGNNLISNGSTDVQVHPENIGVTYENDTFGFPYGMQYMYPCGGLPVTTNRTKWPVGGGAVSVAPGMGIGFKTSFLYINIGKTDAADGNTAPFNYSHPISTPIALSGVNASTWPGQVCIPQLPMPAGMSFQVGDNVTIQVVQTGPDGRAVYSCSDVTLAPNGDASIAKVTPQNCYNSTDIAISTIFTSLGLTAS